MKKEITFEEWETIGDKIKEVRKNLYDLKELLNKVMPKTHTSLKLWLLTEKALGNLRSQLDNTVCGRYYENHKVTNIFYGQNTDK